MTVMILLGCMLLATAVAILVVLYNRQKNSFPHNHQREPKVGFRTASSWQQATPVKSTNANKSSITLDNDDELWGKRGRV
ncbi:MAG: hypothetical protein HWD59_11820 [Coxiellaceae bacterium]|nr:MAG: hypothetical protein HWD59_11820 [Coxiellaceae bacterium]